MKTTKDSIIQVSLEFFAERGFDAVPQKQYSEGPESYSNVEGHNLCEFVNNQFDFWTQNEFARNFRRMVTLEQFKPKEKLKLPGQLF